MSHYDKSIGRYVYKSDLGMTVDFSLDDSAESILAALDSFFTVKINDHLISCGDSDIRGSGGARSLGDVYTLFLPGDAGWFEYAPDLQGVQAILEGIRSGYFDTKQMF